MFIDTSVFIAIIAGEDEAAPLSDIIAAAGRKTTSALVRLETCMRLTSKLDIDAHIAQAAFDRVLAQAGIEIIPITDDVGRLAVDAFARYGKGRGHKAQLNLADCLNYASAKISGMPLLFLGNDFAETDIRDARE